jgi:hypothetical protein
LESYLSRVVESYEKYCRRDSGEPGWVASSIL